jgi:hypothetical protein
MYALRPQMDCEGRRAADTMREPRVPLAILAESAREEDDRRKLK